MTEQERAEWRARLEDAVAATLARRAARRQLREEHQAARDVGLAYRHRDRLARARTDRKGAAVMAADDQDQTLAVDVGELPDVDLTALAGALARTATWSTVTPAAAVALGQLAEQARNIRQQRERR